MKEALLQNLKSETLSPTGDDPRIANLSAAFIKFWNHEKMVQVTNVICGRPGMTESYAGNLLLRVFQNELIENEPSYPLAYEDFEICKEGIFRQLKNESSFAKILRNAEHRQTQSNVVDRYKTIKIALALFRNRLGESPNILDYACSRNHGGKKLKRNLPFEPVECHGKVSGWSREVLDCLMNDALSHHMAMHECVGIDRMPMGGEEDAKWARACRFRPSELLNRQIVTEYDYLDAWEVPGVVFLEGDVLSGGWPEELAGKKFNAIIASTFFYQLSHKERQQLRAEFRTKLTKKGMVIYQDFVRPSPNRRTMHFYKNWRSSPFPYRTVVEFADDESERFYEFIRWDSGRPKLWLPGRHLEEALKKR